jgi:hypothetical protein
VRPKERKDRGQRDLFRARLDQIVDMGHGTHDWDFLGERFGAVYADVPGRLSPPTRLMAVMPSSSTCTISPNPARKTLTQNAPSLSEADHLWPICTRWVRLSLNPRPKSNGEHSNYD